MMVNKTSKKELLSIILFDLGCLDLIESEDNRYRIKLLKGNIKDLAKTTESNKCFSFLR